MRRRPHDDLARDQAQRIKSIGNRLLGCDDVVCDLADSERRALSRCSLNINIDAGHVCERAQSGRDAPPPTAPSATAHRGPRARVAVGVPQTRDWHVERIGLPDVRSSDQHAAAALELADCKIGIPDGLSIDAAAGKRSAGVGRAQISRRDVVKRKADLFERRHRGLTMIPSPLAIGWPAT